MCVCLCLSVCVSVCLSVCSSVYLSVYLCVQFFISLFVIFAVLLGIGIWAFVARSDVDARTVSAHVVLHASRSVNLSPSSHRQRSFWPASACISTNTSLDKSGSLAILHRWALANERPRYKHAFLSPGLSRDSRRHSQMSFSQWVPAVQTRRFKSRTLAGLSPPFTDEL